MRGTDPGLWDTDGDGVSDGGEIAQGTDPLVRDSNEVTGGTASPDFLAECGTAADRLVAWEIVPSAFSFACPTGLTNIVTRTFAVNRGSPWQQFYVSSRANGAMGWNASDVSIRYVVDGSPTTNVIPSVSADSWRVPLGTGPVTNTSTFQPFNLQLDFLPLRRLRLLRPHRRARRGHDHRPLLLRGPRRDDRNDNHQRHVRPHHYNHALPQRRLVRPPRVVWC